MENINNEIWKDIENYESLYQVSNLGHIRNKKRNSVLKGHYLKNYLYVRLTKVGEEIGIHRIVAKHFPEICGEWFEDCNVHHINKNTLDNRAENLEILSASAHSKHHYQEQSDLFKKSSPKRTDSIKKALTGRRATEKHKPINQYSLDGKLIKTWDCISDVKNVGYDSSNVCWCCKGKLKTAYGFLWSYAD